MKVTIKDIAKMAGVSHPTVSKALNDEPGVSEETRRKIISIAKQMNYSPNLAAKMMTNSKTNSIGLIWPQNEGLFFYHFCNRIQKEVSKKGINILMSLSKPEIALHTFNEHFVDMIVIWKGPDWTPTVEFLKEMELFQGQMVVVGGGRIHNAHCITINRISGIFSAVKYLAELGHTKIAFFSEKHSDKLLGFMEGVLKFGLKYHSEYVLTANSELEINEQDLLALLSSDMKPTAFIVDCQGVLFPLLRLFKKHNIRIPDDYSMIVYDDIPEMEIIGIPLTTVGPSIKRMTDELLNIFTKTEKEISLGQLIDIEINSELTVRESTKPSEK